MKVMFISSDNNSASGAFLSMTRLALILKQDYHYDVCVVLPREGSGRDLLEQHGIKTYLIPSHNWIVNNEKKFSVKNFLKYILILKNYLAINKIAKLINALEIDIVHINTSWTYVGSLAALKTKKPFVWHIREFLEEDQGKRIWNRKKGYGLMKKANCAIAISQSIYRKYALILGEENIEVILNGIDEKKYYVEKHEILSNEQYSFLMVGEICESKGQWQAIEACAKLKESGINNFKLKLLGKISEDYRKEIERVIRENNLVNHIDICGVVRNTEDYYKEADVTFMCSKAEAFGRVTVEAMLAGSLVIGADTGATKEIISDKNTGLLYSHGDIDELLKNLRVAIEQPKFVRAIAQNGQKFAKDNFTAAINADRIDSLYKNILNS